MRVVRARRSDRRAAPSPLDSFSTATDTPVQPPVVETVMITTASTQGISFRTPARVLSEDRVSGTGAPSDSVSFPDARP
ncbi:MAG: DUF3124 domain-containing protein [Salinivenus sp.]